MAARVSGVLEMCEEARDLDRLAADLDDVAWQAQIDEERGDRVDTSYDEAFRRARAAESWRHAAADAGLDSVSEAVYEALHALGGDSAAEARIIEILAT